MSNNVLSRTVTASVTLTACLLLVTTALAGAYPRARTDFLAQFPTARLFEAPGLDHARIASGLLSLPTPLAQREAVVLELVSRHGAVIGFDASSMGLALIKRFNQRAGETLRFEQRIDGLPVFGASLIVRFDRDGRLAQLSSTLVSAADATATPAIFEGDAVRIAGQGMAAHPEYYAELGFLPVSAQPVLVYQVIQTTPGPHRFHTFVDAVRGSVLLRYDALLHHQAWVYDHNPVVDDDLAQVELGGIVAEGEHTMHTYGQYARVASCDELSMTSNAVSCLGVTHHAVATSEGGFLDVQPVMNGGVFDDGFAEIMVYYTVDRINRWFREALGFEGLFFDAEVFKATGELEETEHVWVYPNADYPNGFFAAGMDYPGYESPDMIVLGAINGRDLAYDNDVVSHEFTHAVSSKVFSIGMGDLDSLGVNLSTGGVEEGSADYFSSTFQGDPNLGEYVGVDRVLDNDNVCPDDLIGEGHHDGQIVSGAMWSIRSAIGAIKTDNLYFQSLASHQIRNFDDLVSAIEAEAYYLGKETDEAYKITDPDMAAITSELQSRHLEGCRRVVPLREGMEPLLQYTAFSLSSAGSPSAVQYEVKTGSDTEVLSLRISSMGDVDFDVLVRKDEPVSYKWTAMSYPFSWEATYDAEWLYDDKSPITEVRISNATALVLEKDTSYYFSIVCRPNMYGADALGCRNLLSVEFGEEEEIVPEDTDSGLDTSTEDDSETGSSSDTEVDPQATDTETDPEAEDASSEDAGGCGCQVTGSGGSAVDALVLLLSALL